MNGLGGFLVVAILVAAALVIGLGAAFFSLRGRSGTPAPQPARSERSGEPRPRAAIVVNPTKLDDARAVRNTITELCHQHGWTDPLWLETSEDDPGTGQAHEALAAGVDLVCALGGDGTVRAVAAAMVDEQVPMGLLPAGTGNLLARNLELPLESLDECLEVALTGTDRRLDVGTINVVVPGGTQDDAKDYIFLVMAGIGFDATVMAEAPENLKAKVGAAAYVVSGMRNLYGPRFSVDLELDDQPSFHRRVRTVMVGNCGKLQGGLELMPDAEIDDGWLDAILLSPKGVVGWAAVLARVLTKNRKGHQLVDHHRFRSMMLTLDQAEEVQLDGDLIGPGLVLRLAVKPTSLTVRCG